MAVVRWSCLLARTRARPKLSYRNSPPHIRERQPPVLVIGDYLTSTSTSIAYPEYVSPIIRKTYGCFPQASVLALLAGACCAVVPVSFMR